MMLLAGGGVWCSRLPSDLAGIRLERRDVNKAAHLGFVARLGDDGAAIAVGDQNHRRLGTGDHAYGGRDIVRQRGFGFLHDGHRIAVALQDLCHGAPAGAVGERAMDQDNVLDRLGGPRRGDSSRQKGDRCGGGSNRFIWHHALLC